MKVDVTMTVQWFKTFIIDGSTETTVRKLELSSSGYLFAASMPLHNWYNRHSPSIQQLNPANGDTQWIQQFYNNYVAHPSKSMGLGVHNNGAYLCVKSYDLYGTNGYELKITSWNNTGTLANFKELYDNDYSQECDITYQESTQYVFVVWTSSSAWQRMMRLSSDLQTSAPEYLQLYGSGFSLYLTTISQTTNWFHVFTQGYDNVSAYKAIMIRVQNLTNFAFYSGCTSLQSSLNNNLA